MAREGTNPIPRCLLIPGLGGSGRGHWQTHWERNRCDCARVELGCWDDPIRNVWLSRIDQEVGAAQSPVVLAAHGLGCLAVAWWAALLGKRAARHVKGALLVAPPDPDRPDADERIRRFGPLPTAMLPFPAILVASRDDPTTSVDRSRDMAAEWVTDFFDAGHVGHINARSRLGDWIDGQRLLDIVMTGGPGLSHYAYRREPVQRSARVPTIPVTAARPRA